MNERKKEERRGRRRKSGYEGGSRSRIPSLSLSLYRYLRLVLPRKERQQGAEEDEGDKEEKEEKDDEVEEEQEDDHLYKDLHGQWEWNAGTSPVPDFTLASSPPYQLPFCPFSIRLFLPVSTRRFFFFLLLSLSSPLHLPSLLLRTCLSFSLSLRHRTADRDAAHRITTVFYLSLPVSPPTTTLLCVSVGLLLRSGYYYRHHHHHYRHHRRCCRPPPLLVNHHPSRTISFTIRARSRRFTVDASINPQLRRFNLYNAQLLEYGICIRTRIVCV